MRLRNLPGRNMKRRILERRPFLPQPWLKTYRRAVREARYRGWSRAWMRSAGSLRAAYSGVTFPNPWFAPTPQPREEPPMFEPRDYAAAIRRLRGKRTQKHCAEVGGIDRPTWNQYERGKAVPTHNYNRVARGLGVTPIELTEAVIEAWRRRHDRPAEMSSRVQEVSRGVFLIAWGPSVVLSALEVPSV